MPSPAMRPTDPGIVPLTVDVAALTDTGATRASNEDSVVVEIPENVGMLLTKGALAVVADGMGGHEGGEVASEIAVRRVKEVYFSADGDPQASLLKAFAAANFEIFEYARKHSKLAGMGTTCTAVAVINGSAYSAHVGDSRAYLIRRGQAYCMTEDHSATMELVKKGVMTLAEARGHEDRNVILRAMGTHPEVEVAKWSSAFPLHPDDRLLLCSDGLHEMISDAEFASVVEGDAAAQACRKLIDMAVERGCSDNVTAAILHLRSAIDNAGKPAEPHS